MAANNFSKKRLQRLWKAVEHSRQKMEPFRRNRVAAIRQFVGAHYSDDGSEDKTPVNLLLLAVEIYLRELTANAPRALVTTKYTQLKSQAETLRLALDHLIDEIRLGKTIGTFALDAFFSLGIVKVGLNYSDSVEIGGIFHDVGQPFVEPVDLDDFVIDMTAKRFEQVQFIGNRYRLPRKAAKDSKLFDATALKKLPDDEKKGTNETGDEKAESITTGSESPTEMFQDYIELWDIWLPQENRVLTVSMEEQATILREVEWAGPENGPYRLLSLREVPSSLMPLPPVAKLMDLHTSENVLYRKVIRQAERQKKFLGVQGGAEEDGERIVDVADGKAIRVDNPKAAEEFSLGGFDQQTLGLVIHIKDMFSWIAGNLDALGGLGPQSDTVGQDKILTESASKLSADMQDRLVAAVQDILGDLAWYLWTDPLIELPIVKRVPGTDIEVLTKFSAEELEGDFLQYNIQIEPYSMQHRTPGMRLNTLTQIFNTYIVPFAPMLEQQGIVVNFEALLRIISDYSDMPEVLDILDFFGPSQVEERGPVGEPPRQSPVTHRINERVNRPGATRSGKDNALLQTLMGGGAQASEMASVLRPVG